MRKNYKDTWEFNGEKYQVTNFSLNDTPQKNSIYPIVWFEGKLYEAWIKPEMGDKMDRVGLWCIYDKNKKPYWTTVDKVYQIIKI